MFDTIQGFGDQLFAVIILVLCAGITSHFCFGFGTRKAKETFIGLILVLIVGTQFYHLIQAATYVPASKFYVFNVSKWTFYSSYSLTPTANNKQENLHRSDCLYSQKGGKRPARAREVVDFNPCFCLPSVGNCTIIATGEQVTGADCPRDKTAVCKAITGDHAGREIKPYHSSKRDCNGGQTAVCTKTQPCTPCEIDKVISFGAPRCRTCRTDYQGDCNFIPEVGPYCYDSPDSRKVVPCKKCCTEPEAVILDGTCY